MKSENEQYKYWVWIIVKNNEWKILFMKRKSNWLWTIPWWKVEHWEDVLQSAYRELREETWIDNIKLDFFTYSISYTNWIYWKESTFIWWVDSNYKEKILEEENFSEIKFFDLDEINDYSGFEKYDYIILDMLKWKQKRCYSYDDILV